MESKQHTAMIAGASGLIGGYCLTYLLASPDYSKVIALVRKPLQVQHPKLSQVQVDFDFLDNESAKIKADHIYCCLGTTIKKAGSKNKFEKVDYTFPLEIAKIALKNGTSKYLIVTAMGANKNSLVFYNKVKGKVELALKQLSFLSLHIFRPSLLLGNRQEKRFGEKLAIQFFGLASPFFSGPLKKYKAIQAKTVAFAMIQQGLVESTGNIIYESQEIQSIYDRFKKKS